jgi:hypothetical protein
VNFPDGLIRRFYAKVAIPRVNGAPDRDQCWLWTGAKTRSVATGLVYGHIRLGRKHVKAHRLALAIRTRRMPDEMDAAHSDGCVSKLCCNPWHLEWQSKAQNRYYNLAARYGPVHTRRRQGVRNWV